MFVNRRDDFVTRRQVDPVRNEVVRPLDIEQAHALGIREIVLKPNTVEELGPVVQRLLSNRSSVSEKAVEPTIMVE